ncbi:MAG: hypothetical protein PHR35_00835 [Kiritimatiellae bacterium]|nr:hypothetical protein [Kiritimatiellia bacterium]
MSETPANKSMPPDLQASVLCDDVRQERNGKFILIGIFDGLMLPSFPAVFPRLCVVNRWCSGEGEFAQRTRIVSADGKIKLVEGRPVPVRLTNVEQLATSVEYFVNFQVPEAGLYWVEIMLDQRLRLRYPLQIRRANEST